MKKLTLVSIVIWLLSLIQSPVFAQALSRLSQPQHDLGLVANAGVSKQKLSSNGRYITFISDAGNLVAGDTNYADDVFVKDLVSGTISRVSELSNGSEMNATTVYRISRASDDGRFVSFMANADNLPMANGGYILYLKDMQTGTLVADSVNSTGTAAFNVDSFFSELEQSSDGRYVAFSSSDDIINNPSLSKNVFRKDRQANSYQLVSINHNGAAAGGAHIHDMSANGRFLTFYSDEEVLATNPNPALGMGYLRDMNFANTVMFHVDGNNQPIVFNNLLRSSVSNQGDVAFCSFSDDLVVGDSNTLSDVFVFDNGLVSRISLDGTQQQVTDVGCYIYYIQQQVEISDDGNKLAFIHGSNELTEDDNAAQFQAYTYDRNLNQTQLISQSAVGISANQDVLAVGMNADGSRSTIMTAATSLDHDLSTLIYNDLYLYSSNSNQLNGVALATEPVNHLISDAINPVLSADMAQVLYSSKAPNADPSGGIDTQDSLFIYNRESHSQSQLASFVKFKSHDMSDNGRYVVFVSDRFQPINSIELGAEYVFLFDQQTAQFSQIALGNSPKVSDDGQVVFVSDDDSLSPDDDNGTDDVYLYQQSNQQLSLVSKGLNNEAANSISFAPDIAGTGVNTWLVFASLASNLIANDDTPSVIDIFMLNWPQGIIQRVTETATGVGQAASSSKVAISSNTQHIIFDSYAQNLVAAAYPLNSLQAFSFDRTNHSFAVVSVNDTGNPHEGSVNILSLSVSASGRFVSYQTNGYFGNEEDQNDSGAVYLFDQIDGEVKRISQQLNGDELLLGSQYGFVQADDSVTPPLVSVVFNDRGELLDPRPNTAYQQVMLYQQGGAGVDLTMQVVGDGSVSGNLGYFCQADCENTYDLGTTLNLLAIADNAATFLGWSGDVCQDDNQSCTVVMNEHQSIQAIFSNDDVIFVDGFE